MHCCAYSLEVGNEKLSAFLLSLAGCIAGCYPSLIKLPTFREQLRLVNKRAYLLRKAGSLATTPQVMMNIQRIPKD